MDMHVYNTIATEVETGGSVGSSAYLAWLMSSKVIEYHIIKEVDGVFEDALEVALWPYKHTHTRTPVNINKHTLKKIPHWHKLEVKHLKISFVKICKTAVVELVW